MEAMLQYVVGLMFSCDRTRLVLMQKERPRWQAGLLNGPGGKVEPNETPEHAIVREICEEAGVITSQEEWECAVVVQGQGYVIYFFALYSDECVDAAKTQTDERVFTLPVSGVLRADLLPNLRWIIPLCIDPCCSLPLVVTDALSRTRVNP